MHYADFLQKARTTKLMEHAYFSRDILPEKDDSEWNIVVRFLESEGFAVAACTNNFPMGLYCAEGTKNGFLQGWGIEKEIPTKIIVTNIGWNFRSHTPEAPRTDIQGLKLVPHHTMAVMFCRKGTWSAPIFLPHGSFGMSIADTTGIQYGQAAFEGCCAMRNKEGDAFSFRLEKNAIRFNKSIQALDLPGVDAEKMHKLFLETIRQNKKYIPQDGKLYIRPSVTGLNGGLGIIVPETSLITVEVAAFGSYLPESIRVEALRYIHRPPSGVNKIAPNYGANFAIKHATKNRGFNDYISFDERGNVEEVSTCALAFIDKNGDFIFPPVQDEIDTKDRHILPSITRESTIEILKNMGETVIIRDVSFEEITKMKGCFTMGNAVGVLHVSEICLRKTPEEKGEIINLNSEDVRQKVFAIRDNIYASRVGNLEGSENWAERIG